MGYDKSFFYREDNLIGIGVLKGIKPAPFKLDKKGIYMNTTLTKQADKTNNHISHSSGTNIVNRCFSNIGPESEVSVALQNLRWSMLDKNVNSLTLRSMETLFTTRLVARSGVVSELPKSQSPMVVSYQFKGETYTTEDFLDRTYTNALLVMKNGVIVYENYLNNMTPDTCHMGWSMTKSIVSTLIGMAYEEGRIHSLDDPIVNYIPELKNGAYNDVSIRHILSMTSGVAYEERYDFDNPGLAATNHIKAIIKNVSRFADAAVDIKKKYEPGKVSEYKTIDTAVLGWLLEKVLDGSNVSSYMAQKLWEPLGAEQNGFFIMDGTPEVGREFTGAGFNAILRDWARFGQMILNKGEFNGHKFISSDYLEKATQSFLPEHPETGGYGYQWWTFSGTNSFAAVGILGQFVFIDPDTNTVIVKLSYCPTEEMDDIEKETELFLKAVSKWTVDEGSL
ncbi:serine hydrolase [Vibrio sp. Y2-5]|uniref:serine hydrolase domain-containing protein n=1 Tax=Vibrio sp. Y2-5 TaxID=2743977 RepID=UPI0016602EE1|nr:serine hydrolase [Vibrio sp. Y2-5]MBD0788345.1 serine hydrolase [Vibrio sp. Y2-5]